MEEGSFSEEISPNRERDTHTHTLTHAAVLDSQSPPPRPHRLPVPTTPAPSSTELALVFTGRFQCCCVCRVCRGHRAPAVHVCRERVKSPPAETAGSQLCIESQKRDCHSACLWEEQAASSSKNSRRGEHRRADSCCCGPVVLAEKEPRPSSSSRSCHREPAGRQGRLGRCLVWQSGGSDRDLGLPTSQGCPGAFRTLVCPLSQGAHQESKWHCPGPGVSFAACGHSRGCK